MKDSRRFLLIVVMVLAAAFLAACGAPSTPAATATPEPPQPVDITISMTDAFKYEPISATVTSGGEVNLTLINEGALEHSYVIMERGYTVEAPWDDQDIAAVLNEWHVQPGQTETTSFTAPSEPGTYQIVCNVAGHLEGGMIGELIVTE